MRMMDRLLYNYFYYFILLRLAFVGGKKFIYRKKLPISPCKIFDRNDIRELLPIIKNLVITDPYLKKRLLEKRLKFLRLWEYGILLNYLSGMKDIDKFKILDVGPGSSTFCNYLSTFANSVFTIDYKNPLEKFNIEAIVDNVNVRRFEGDMRGLPFSDEEFDLVYCISTIEHLDDLREQKKVAYDDFLKRTKKALRELIRVTKHSGFIYITSDVFIPEKVKIDSWSKKRPPYDTIWSAYRYEEIDRLFITTMRENNCELEGIPDFGMEKLEKNAKRSSYRDRFFTTFTILAKKK